MAILDPFTLKRPAERTETRTFNENSIELTLTLSSRSDYTRRLLADEKTRLYQARYVTGEEVKGEDGKIHMEITLLPPVDGMIPAVGTWLCSFIARLEMMQVAKGAEQPLTFVQWAAYGVLMPDSMAEISDWSYRLLNPDEDKPGNDLKNASGEAQAP